MIRAIFILMILTSMASADDTSPAKFEDKTIELGESIEVLLDEVPKSVVVSQDSLVNWTSVGRKLFITAKEFGETLFTIFLPSGHLTLVRIRIPSYSSAPVTNPSPSDVTGTTGAIGTRFGLRSQDRFLELVTLQEEFAELNHRTEAVSHSGFLRLFRPLTYLDPKPDRVLGGIHFRRDDKHHSWIIGDTSVGLGNAFTGPMRGIRFQKNGGRFRPFVGVGGTHFGGSEFWFGTRPTFLGSAGFRWNPARSVYLDLELTPFEKNRDLGLFSSGMDTVLGLSWSQGFIREANAKVLWDLKSRFAESARVDLGGESFSVSGEITHYDSQLESFQAHTKYGDGFNGFSLGVGWNVAKQMQLSATTSKSLSIASVGDVVGEARLTDSNVSLQWNPTVLLRNSFGISVYENEFRPLSAPGVAFEKGTRGNWLGAWAFQANHEATTALEFANVRAPQLGTAYDTRQALLGFRWLPKAFSLHSELGYSQYRDKNLALSDELSHYLIGRFSARWEAGSQNIELLAQDEQRFQGTGKNNLFRVQANGRVKFNNVHEITLSLFHNFEWQRRIYRDTRGLYTGYVYRFGGRELDELSGTADLNGKADEETDSGVWIPRSGLKVLLVDDGGEKHEAVTDAEGRFHFLAVKRGSVKVSIEPSATARLISESPMTLRLDRDREISFRFSQLGEVSGIVFLDVNGSGTADESETPLTGVKVRLNSLTGSKVWHAEATEGKFRFTQIPPGRFSIEVDATTLPNGFRLDKTGRQNIELKKNEFREVWLSTEAGRGLSGRLFRDKNANRVFDPGEVGIDGVTVRFGSVTTKTGEGGRFLFRNLPPGKNRVRFKQYQSEEIELGEGPENKVDVWVPAGR